MNSEVVKVFVGYDPRERIAWHTMVSSIIEKSSRPLAFVPLDKSNLKGIFSGPADPRASNAFSYTRFLVPYLCGFSGVGIYFDCDMLLRTDISDLLDTLEECSGDKAVHVVKHDYTPSSTFKYLNNTQYAYPRKNWSSVMVFNASHPKNRCLDPSFVGQSSPSYLHRFQWLEDHEIGELDKTWNWLVGEYSEAPDNVRVIHWTLGGPYFNEHAVVEYSDEWRNQLELVNYCDQKCE